MIKYRVLAIEIGEWLYEVDGMASLHTQYELYHFGVKPKNSRIFESESKDEAIDRLLQGVSDFRFSDGHIIDFKNTPNALEIVEWEETNDKNLKKIL